MSAPDVASSTAAAAATVDPSALIGAISSGAANPLSLILSQLGGQTSDNPAMAVLSRLLEQRQASPSEAGERNDEDADAAAVLAEAKREERERRMQELRETVERVYAELEALRARNDALAAALGACFLCFGTDPLCQECGGRGIPGSRPPEPAAYRDFVVPALQRVRMIQADPVRRPLGAPPSAGAMRGAPGETRSWHSAATAPTSARPATA
jgi:hypothetical protein